MEFIVTGLLYNPLFGEQCVIKQLQFMTVIKEVNNGLRINDKYLMRFL